MDIQISAANVVGTSWLPAEARLMEAAAAETDVRAGVKKRQDRADCFIRDVQDATGQWGRRSVC